MSNRIDQKTSPVLADNRRALRWAGLVFAIFFPSLITWAYFIFAERYSTGIKQSVFLSAKITQFAFPLLWTWLVLREPLRTSRPTWSGVLMGITFGAAVAIVGTAVFDLYLRDTQIFAAAAEMIQQKIKTFGIDTAGKYYVLAGFYSICHSFLEEYYWRWFVFKQLRRVVSLWPAVFISGVGFTLHHIVILCIYFHGVPWLVGLLAVGTAIGGFVWAWLYERSDSIFDTWPSHLLIDVGVFFGVGYELVRHAF
ncbi:MAG TPA: CPBP family intramembrane glutamic endopeptidase [Lacipirellulaceae bacterium]|nr:CPBP family intramembrane glutamic endopeptidase [Lacipirellulaceae bacterium]